jgi:hypothetical protein
MMRPAPHRAWLCAAILLCMTMAGCGGESSVSVGVPTENNGPIINGQVQMPSGQIAAAPSPLERLASYVVARVEALVANNVFPVGGGVEVRLRRIGPDNVRGGRIVGGEIVNRALTATDGSFALRMPTATDPNTCRFLLEVGSSRGQTLTRAFVDAGTVDVNFETEAAVRLLLDEIAAGSVGLCDLSAAEILSVRRAVQESPNQAFGVNAAAINASAKEAASGDAAVQAAIAQVTGNVTPLPTSTNTAPPAATATNTGPVATETAPPPPTRTHTPPRTDTVGPTRTSTPEATATDVPTRTHTAGPTNTNTVAPTATHTAVPTNTATTVPTSTATAVPTSTATAVRTNTATAVPTATATRTNTPATVPPATATATAPPTATPTGAAPEVNLGVVAGTAGFAVDVPLTLVANGAQIASVAADIEFDAEALAVVSAGGGDPDCRIDARLAGGKDVVARASDLGGGRGLLRVGIIGLDNNAVISSGPLAVCRFLVAADASGSLTLLNTPEAAGQQAQAIAVAGSDGRIDVSAAPPTLGLSAGTAAAGATADITATLVPRGATVAAVATDIRFDAARLSAGAEPDCTIAAAVAALDKELVARALPADNEGRAGVRVGVFGRDNNTALPAGALFSCRFEVESNGPPIALEHSAEGASPTAAPVGLLAAPGTITVP